ncbi:phage/plasmid replication protein, II/X family [Variovorax sp. CCNWLW186]|uniref:phage/plasmid replication protein, II/X family n=1 Tax=Variovorax sp. CCNWLW186 TaxID=3127473 RepID=UPI0030782A74
MLFRLIPEVESHPDTDTEHTARLFKSSLFDTMKVKIELPAKAVKELHASVLKHDGYNFKVPGPFPGCIATIFSRPSEKIVYIEASPKFLTGQNVVGIEDAHQLTSEIITSALVRAGLSISQALAQRVEEGTYELLRADFVAHCDCGSPGRLHAVMLALRHLAVGTARDVSFYGVDTLYIGQHSRRKSLKIYNKGSELSVRPIPEGVPNRTKLTSKAQSLLRFEIVLRAEELKRLGRSDPKALTAEIARGFMQRQFDFVTRAGGIIPDLALASNLSRACQAKLRAWVLGDTSAFAGSPTTLASNRRQVLATTGIDVASPIDAETQRLAVMAVRDVLRDGVGFKAHPKRWEQLKKDAEAHGQGVLRE